MTDLYGVRVLELDPQRRHIRLRVTVIYYDIGSHAPLTDDPSFFLRLFGGTAVTGENAASGGTGVGGETGVGAPLGDVVTLDQLHDEAWVDANTRWFVERVRRVATRNHPMTEEVEERLEEERVGFPWEGGSRFHEMSPESAAELVLSEETNVGADYDVVVTDPRWIEHLSVGDWWRTASYPTHADRLLAGEAAAIPDLRDPATVLKPFGTEDEPRHLAFSDDGRFLAVTSEEGELVVYDATTWRECLRTRADGYLSPWLTWVPGEAVITLRHHEDARPQLAFDVPRGTPAEAPPQSGRSRSATGRYRTEWTSGPAVVLRSSTGEERVVAVPVADGGHAAGDGTELGAGPDPYEAVAFSADESRTFVAQGSRVYVMDPADGRVLDVIENDEIEIRSLRVSPDGQYLALSGDSLRRLEVVIQRVGDHQVVTRHEIGRGWYPLQTYELEWSPDGRWLAANLRSVNQDWETSGGETHVFRIGLPAAPRDHVTGL